MKKLLTAILLLVLCLTTGASAQVSTNTLLLEDNAMLLPNLNTITIAAPPDNILTTNYALCFPNQDGLGFGSLWFVDDRAVASPLGPNAYRTGWLPIGNAGDVLTVVQGRPSWQALPPTSLTLTHKALWVGDPTNHATELAPGAVGQVLRVHSSGVPSWQTINMMPNGTTTNSTLVWNGTQWIENTQVVMNPTNGNVTTSGNLTVNGTQVNLPNGSIDNSELANSSINLTYGTGLSGGASVALGGTLSLQNTGVTAATAGTGINLSGPTGNVTITNTGVISLAGTANQVNVSAPNGAVTLSLPQNIHANATPTFSGLTLSNMTAGSSSTDIVVSNGGLFQTRTANSLIGLLTLNHNSLWVGNTGNTPVELPTTGVSGAVLQQNGTGAPVWSNDLNVNNITVNNDLTVNGDQVNNGGVTFNGPSFTTSSTTTSTFNGPTNLQNTTNVSGDVTIGGSTTTINSPTINIGNSSSTTTLDGAVIFTNAPEIPLTENSMWVGDASNKVSELTAGTNGQVLRINGTTPTWQSVNLLPAGTTSNSTLVWNGTQWIENTQVVMNPTSGDITTNGDVNAVEVTTSGNTTVGGDLTVNGTQVNLPNGSIDNSELANSSVNVSYGAGLNGDASVALGGTLNLQNTGVTGAAAGTGINVSGPTGNVTITNTGVTSLGGTTNQVNVSAPNGAVTLSLPQNIDANATPTFDGVTLDNLSAGSISTDIVVSNGGNLETRTAASLIGASNLTQNSVWVGNATNNPAELPTTNVAGAVLQQNGAGAPIWSNDLNVNNITVNNDLTVNGDQVNNGGVTFNGPSFTTSSTTTSTFNGPTNLDGPTTINNNLTVNGNIDLPLAEDNMWVGNGLNRAAELAPGSNGQVLRINGTTPTWQSVNLLPNGTTSNTTLVWNGTQWIENTQVVMNPTSGDITTNGDVNAVEVTTSGNTTVGGDLTVNGTQVDLPNGSIDNSELANSSVNLNYGTGLNGDASVALGGTLNLQNTGVTSLAGTTNQVNVSAPNGAVTLSLPQNIDANATPTFDGVTLDNLSAGSTSTDIVVSNGGNLETRTAASLIGASNLTQNSVWVGNATNNPAELPTTNVAGAVLQQNGTGAPIWSNDLNVNNITVNNDLTVNGDQVNNGGVTFNGPSFTTSSTTTSTFNGPTNLQNTTNVSGDVTIGGSTTTINSPTINIGNSSSTTTLDGTVIFTNAPEIPLTENSMWVGDASNKASELTAGTNGQVLRINGTTPTWQSVNLLPNGTTSNTTLVWNGTQWIENTQVVMNPTSGDITTNGDVNAVEVTTSGNTTVGGDLTVNGTQVNLPNGSIDNSELANSSVNVSYGAGLNGDASVALGGTLNLQNTGVTGAAAGTGINVSGPTGNVTITNTGVTSLAGTTNQVNVSAPNGAVTLSLPQNIDANATPTFDGVTLDNLSAGSTSNDVVVSNGGSLQTRSVNSIVGASTLTQNNLWVGNASNNPSELAPGTSGQVLRVNGSGAPSWQTVNLLPTGTTNNATLVWNGTAWVENIKVTLNPVTGDVAADGSITVGGNSSVGGNQDVGGNVTVGGNTIVSGNLTVNGAQVNLPNGSIDNSELANSSINVAYGTGLNGSASVALGGTLNLQNTGVTSLAGTTNQVSVSAPNGAVTLSLPQSIHTSATPTFNGMTLSNLQSGSTAVNIVVSNNGVLETRSVSSLPSGPTSLNHNSMWVGNASNQAAQLGSTGVSGAVLQLNSSGSPAWSNDLNVHNVSISSMLTVNGNQVNGGDVTFNGNNFIVSGTTNSVFNGPLTVNGATTLATTLTTNGHATLNSGLTVNGSPVNLPNGVIDNSELANSSINVTYGSGLSGSSTVSLGGTLNLQNTGVTTVNAGSGINVSGPTGSVTITNAGVTAINGTANQVSASASTGSVTLSLPQNIHSGATPTFNRLTLTNLPASSTATNIVVSNGGSLETRTLASLSSGVTSIAGTPNQVNVSASTGAVTLSLPQNVHTAATPTFGGLTLSAMPSSSTATNIVVSNGGVLETRTLASIASGVTSITGTANQVNVSASTGGVTLSLPQNIHTAATPTFSRLTLSGLPSSSTAVNVLVSNGGVLETRTIASLGTGSGWGLTGNAGTTDGTNFLGTTDNVAFNIKVNNQRAFRIEPDATTASPDITGGHSANSINATGTAGNVIAGGGTSAEPNLMNSNVDYSSIGGGAGNEIGASSAYAVIGGGYFNEIDLEGDNAFIGGGQGNIVYDRHAVVVGGFQNKAGSDDANYTNGAYSAVVGGYQNRATAYKSFVGGGLQNLASGERSAVVAGNNNSATASEAFIGGGKENEANAEDAAVLGGGYNIVSGSYSSILGGRGLTLSGSRSMGFLAGNTGSNNMTVSTSDVAVLGNANLWLVNNTNTPSQARFYEANATTGTFPATANYSSFQAQSQSQNIQYKLPDTAGIVGDVLGVKAVSGTDVTLDWVSGGGGSEGVGSISYARKTADEVVSGTTLQNDDHLFVSLAANKTYEISGIIVCEREDGNPDMDIAWSVPGGTGTGSSNSTMMLTFEAYTRKESGNRDVGADIRTSSGTAPGDNAGEIDMSSCSDPVFIHFKGIVITGSTSGNITFKWAPTTGSGDEIRVKKNSYMTATQIN